MCFSSGGHNIFFFFRCGIYYPAASFYYGGSARANFGPSFRFPPKISAKTASSPPKTPAKTADSSQLLKSTRGGGAGEEEGGELLMGYRPMSECVSELQVASYHEKQQNKKIKT
jgi:hypothetical protein